MGCLFAFSWVFPSEVVVIEYWLMQPGVIIAFDCVWEVLCEDFVSCHDATDCWEFKFYDFVESFWAEFEEFCACVDG